MTFKDYTKTIEENFPKILDDNILFWNLWNVCYPFEILENHKEEEGYMNFYHAFNDMWKVCWAFNDTKIIDYDKFYMIFEQYYPFIIDEDGELLNPKGILQKKYDDLEGDNLVDSCIIQLISGFNIIYQGIRNKEKHYGSKANFFPLEVIAVILTNHNMGFLQNNMNDTLVNGEINAQIRLIKELSAMKHLTYSDRSIYRNSVDASL